MAAVSGIALVTSCSLPSVGIVDDLSWANYYDTWGKPLQIKQQHSYWVVVHFLQALGIPADIANGLMAVFCYFLCSNDPGTATRIQRFIITELGEAVNIPFSKIDIGYSSGCDSCFLLALWNIVDPSTGTSTQAGWVLGPHLWCFQPDVGCSKLMVLLLYLWKPKKKTRFFPLAIPFAILYQ
ncbi:MAG: hypothetical protein Ct9H300mP2_2330 [Candidatus Neomarinimicrobiota bacterium]|nr:MAG: hypothetical protein Ct9H300mP2_2330 [Candidatus Neomarinimicrobiota bacterium]